MDARLSMRWRDALFASWAVDPALVADRLPAPLTVDTYGGDAYLSVVPFEIAAVRPRGVPAVLGRTFPELNLRTYVTADGDPGIYFFNLDAADPLGVAVARLLYRLPYYAARMDVERTDDRVTLTSERYHPGAAPLSFEAAYGPTDDDPAPPESGSLSEFLVERYRFYVGEDPLRYGDVAHEAWPLRDATADLRAAEAFTANGFDPPPGEPHLAYSRGVDVEASWLRRYRSG